MDIRGSKVSICNLASCSAIVMEQGRLQHFIDGGDWFKGDEKSQSCR